MPDSTSLNASIERALDSVFDPCSVAAGRPTSIRALGLVLDYQQPLPEHLHVRFCVTFAGCTMAPHFMEAARDALLSISGIRRVTTEVDTEHVWTPPPSQVMATMRSSGTRPQAWRDSAQAKN